MENQNIKEKKEKERKKKSGSGVVQVAGLQWRLQMLL